MREKTQIQLLVLVTLIFAGLIFFVSSCNWWSPTENEVMGEETSNSKSVSSTGISFITASDFINDITVGINIGNSLDSWPSGGRTSDFKETSFYETAWGNPVITQSFVKAIHDAGFNTVRLPVTWYFNTYNDEDGNLIIREEWLERVGEVINYALELNMYVVLDSHHDSPIIWAQQQQEETVKNNVTMLWTQIAEYFRDYDYKLIFEGFNELNDKDDSWKFSSACASINNTLNQAFVDAVRSTGGNNTYRILVCGTYLNETSNRTLNSFVLPDDIVANRLVIAVHLYDSTMGSTLTDTFKRLQKFSSSQGAPVIIDEFGTKSDFSPAENRDIQAGKYVANANLCGIKCFWWDDGGDYAIFDRKTEKVSEPDVVYALMHPEEFSDITSKNID